MKHGPESMLVSWKILLCADEAFPPFCRGDGIALRRVSVKKDVVNSPRNFVLRIKV